MTPPTGDERAVTRRDQNQAPARGTRGAGPEGAPPGARKGPAAPAAAAAPTDDVTKVAPPAPGATVRKSAPAAPKPPVPAAFPPPELRAECEALVARYPERQAALIPVLHLAQRRLGGWISPELEAGIAAWLGVPDQHVRGVLTFYTMFNTKPVGRHHVQVCRTLSCWLRGSKDLLGAIERKTGLRPGQTDAERKFTVTEVECLGLCEVAPALFVNDDAHVNLTPAAVEKLLDGCK
ncbi:MAG: NAD(P)H-dependent oxidoreductase subunit E [Planctomycetes bacterium]|nr:NAD(P)H-dependent oxidoreductase subunit E [Planctomycetota bacterium]